MLRHTFEMYTNTHTSKVTFWRHIKLITIIIITITKQQHGANQSELFAINQITIYILFLYSGFFRWRSIFFQFSFTRSFSFSALQYHLISARFRWLVREFLHFISMWFIKIQMNVNFIINRIKFGIEKK